MTNSGFSDYQKLDLSKDLIPIQRDDYFENDANVDSNDKVRQISAQDFYDDILTFVEAHAKADLKIMNVQEDIPFPNLDLLADNKTFKLTSPKGYIDDTVTLTSNELTSSPLDLETQKDYNEYSYDEIVELKRLLEFYTEKSLFLDANDNQVNLSQIEDAISLLTINLKNQLSITPGYSAAITVDDGSYIISLINDLVSKLQDVREQLKAVYEATLVSKYVSVVVDTSDSTTTPQPGEMVIRGNNITGGELGVTDVVGVRVSKFAYRREVEDITGQTPDIIINYLPFDKEGSIFRIDESDYKLKFNPDADSITEINDYFEFELEVHQVTGGPHKDSTPDTIVGMMVVKTDDFDLNANRYMTVDGLDPLDPPSGKRRFENTIYSHGGFRFTNDPTGSPVLDDVGNVITGLIHFDNVDGIIKRNNNNIVEFKDNKTVVNRQLDLTGPLVFERGSTILAQNPRSLSGRAGLQIKVDEAIAFVSTSTYKETISVWKYDGGAQDGRTKTFYVTANGNVDAWGYVKAGNKLISTKLDSGQNSNLVLQHNGNTRVYVGNDLVTINTQGKLSKEGTEDNHLITKKYVDDKIGNFLSGSCIDINGGLLCAGDPHPTFMETINTDGRIVTSSLPNIPEGYRHLSNFDDGDNKFIYRVEYASNNKNKRIYKTNYITNSHEEVSTISHYSFNATNSKDRVYVNCGAVSHDQKYAIVGSKLNMTTSGGTSDTRYQNVFESDFSSPNYTHTIDVTSGKSNYYYSTSMLATGPKPDNESGYMIGAFRHSGWNNGDPVFANKICIYKFGSNKPVMGFLPAQSKYFDDNATPYVHKGNPEFEEYFVTVSATSGNGLQILKVGFADDVYSCTLDELISKSKTPEPILTINYLPRSRRYYLGGYKKGYLTRPYDGPLDDTCFDDAISFEIPNYTGEYKGATLEIPRYSGYVAAFEFNNEIVVVGEKTSKTIYNPDDNQDKKTVQAPQAIMIYDGGDAWKRYESEHPDDDEWNATPRDFPYSKVINSSYFKGYEVDSPSQLIGDQSIRLQKDLEIKTPGMSQPYTQPLYWNGVLLDTVDHTEGNDEYYPSTFGINKSFFASPDTHNVRDGGVYQTYNGSLSYYRDYNGLFLTSGFIKENCNLPDDYKDAVYNDFKGTLVLEGTKIYTVDGPGKVVTFNDVTGVQIDFNVPGYNNTIDDSNTSFDNMNIPNAVRALAPLKDSGIGPLE